MSLGPAPVGFLAGGSVPIELTISADTNDYDIFVAAGSPSDDNVEVWVHGGSGVVVGSTSVGSPGMTRGTGWGANSVVRIKVASGTFRIAGKGPNGGSGASWWNGDVKSPSSRMGGGGGGAGGATVGAGGAATSPATAGSTGTATAGGAGGSGSSAASVVGIVAAGNGSNGGPALEAPNSGEDIELEPAAGATIQLWGAGGSGGGGGASSSSQGDGGAGGAPANAGSNGTGPSPGTGGSAGASKSGSGTINNSGDGTVDEDGP